MFLDNKCFWQNMEPFFSLKSRNKQEISFTEKKDIISNKTNVTKILNEYFKHSALIVYRLQ